MVHRILVTATLFASLAPLSCRSSGNSSSQDAEQSVEATPRDISAEKESFDRDTEKRTGGGSVFGRGVVTVFGIKIPTGMTPARGPEKVYRFEGKLKAERTAMLIRDQIVAQKETRENDGYLFRFARSKKSKSDDARFKAVRVFSTETGSALDIWLEKEYSAALPDTRAVTSFPVPKLNDVRRQIVSENTRVKKRRERADALRALQKIEKNEPLTKQEAASGVFD